MRSIFICQAEYEEIILLCKSLAEAQEEEALGSRKKDLDAKVLESEQRVQQLTSQLQQQQLHTETV